VVQHYDAAHCDLECTNSIFVRESILQADSVQFSQPGLTALCFSLAGQRCRGVNHLHMVCGRRLHPATSKLGTKEQKEAPETGALPPDRRFCQARLSRCVTTRRRPPKESQGAHATIGIGSQRLEPPSLARSRRDLLCPFRGACICSFSIRTLLFPSNLIRFLLSSLKTSMGYSRLGPSPSGQSPTQESGHGSIGAPSKAAVPPPTVEAARVTRGIATTNGTGCFPTRQSCLVSSGRASACFWALKHKVDEAR
jgi:hypothetical protein